jgi:hypothetical protein
MIRLRALAALALALILALTSGTLAMARGQTMAAGEIVICSGGAAVTLAVDAEGKPTGPAHICPDCALTFLVAAAAPPATIPTLVETVSALALPGIARPTPAAHVLAPTARGPPPAI